MLYPLWSFLGFLLHCLLKATYSLHIPNYCQSTDSPHLSNLPAEVHTVRAPTPALFLNSRCPGTLVLPVLCPRAPTLPLRELIRKAHCSPCAYPAPGTAASGKVTGRRTVTLSMAGNLGGGQSRLGCSGLEAHFCHQICWVTWEMLLDPPGPSQPNL